jgi:V8-like Glu-specific endopeptidase
MITGTAFFIGPTTLVSAGHLVSDEGTKVRAQLPGTLKVERDSDSLWIRAGDSDVPQTFICVVVKSLYKKKKIDVDITVLDCRKSYRASQWLEIDKMTLTQDLAVDLIGYPGMYTANHLAKTQNFVLSDIEEQDVHELLPRCELVLSHGKVLQHGALVSYKLSTTGGMSGGPVVVNGKAVGK